MKKLLLLLTLYFISTTIISQPAENNNIQLFLRKDEAWFGAAVNEGHNMPFAKGYSFIPDFAINMK